MKEGVLHMTHAQCGTRSAVTFPAAEQHHSSASATLRFFYDLNLHVCMTCSELDMDWIRG